MKEFYKRKRTKKQLQMELAYMTAEPGMQVEPLPPLGQPMKKGECILSMVAEELEKEKTEKKKEEV